MDTTEEVPRMIKVRQELGSLYIKLPRRHGSSRSLRQHTLLLMVGIAMLGSCGGFLSSLWAPFLEAVDPSLAVLAIPLVLLMSVLPYAGVFFVLRRATADGEVELTQRMLRMEGRRKLELPLEEVSQIDVVRERDRGRLRFHTTRGEIELFDGLFHHELLWLHRTISAHTSRLRAQMQGEGHDTDVVARPPEEIARLLQ